MNALDTAVAGALTTMMGRRVEIRGRSSLAGGSINRTERLETTAGRFILKSTGSAPEGFFHAEAEGLRVLAPSTPALAVPRVVACADRSPSFIVLEDLGDGSPATDFDEQLGRGLAALHHTGAERFGFGRDNFCGLTPQPNPWTDRWVEFYAVCRLGFQVRLARDAGHLSASETATIEGVIARLERWIAEAPDGPALIHGDLWPGNVHVAGSGRPALIDPAAYYGHREAEFGMMTLFGGFSPRVFAAYDEAYPLEPGWRERNGLYQLYHLLNHLNLFGSGYRASVIAQANRFT